jgi:2-octaprenylphenol hydroxylase
MDNCSIAVVGGGLVGAAATLSLSKRLPGYQIHWLDRGSLEPSAQAAEIEARVIACTPGSQSYLDTLGAWQHVVLERIQSYQSMRVWDQLGGAAIEFQSRDLGAAQLGSIVEVSELLRALYSSISTQSNVRLWPKCAVESLVELQQQRRLILSSGETIDCELIVGADGSRSTLRELAAIKTRVRTMRQQATVAVVSHQYEHRSTAWQAFGESGPLAFLPLPDSENGEHQSAIVWSMDDRAAATISELSDAELKPLLESGIDGRLGKIRSLRQRATFPLQQLHAQNYVLPGLCLLGDAVHTIHPLAGQGANLGFRDVAALERELCRAQARKVWVGDMSVLRRYERSRKLENLTMLAGMEAFRHGFGSKRGALRWLFNKGMRQVNRWDFIKNQFAKQAMH